MLAGDFEAIGGFNEDWVSVEDLDFAKRLSLTAEAKERFKTITRAHIVTSCRKFDTFGDWYLIRTRVSSGGSSPANHRRMPTTFTTT